MQEPTDVSRSNGISPLSQQPAAVEGCTVAGSGIEAAAVHQHAEFIITAVGLDGKKLDCGGTSFFVAIRGPQRVRARITDNSDGTYTVRWTPPQSGKYSVAVSLFGVPLAGSPYAVSATPPLPFAPNCEVRGVGKAVARAMQTFDVSFRDRLGFTTHAVDLDVFAEPVPVALLNADDQAGTMGQTGKSRKSKAMACAVDFAIAPPAEAEEAIAERLKTVVLASGNEGQFENGRPTAVEVRRRITRVKARNTLVIRESEEVDSAQIGVVQPGQMFTVVMEKLINARVRSRVAYSKGLDLTRVTARANHEPVITTPILTITWAVPTQVRAMIALDTLSYSVEHTRGTSPRTKKRKAAAAAVADPTAANANDSKGDIADDAMAGNTATIGDEIGASNADANGAAAPAEPCGLTGKVGWVTLLKDGARHHRTSTSS